MRLFIMRDETLGVAKPLDSSGSLPTPKQDSRLRVGHEMSLVDQ